MYRLAASNASVGILLSQRRTTAMTSNACGTRWISSQGLYRKIAFIGAGTMAKAMIDPLIQKGYQPESQVAVYDVSTKAIREVQQQYPKIGVAQSIEEVVEDACCVVLAVKPQNITASFWEQFPKDPSKLPPHATLLSIVAGTPVEAFKPSGIQKIVRSMPNTPSTIGQGMTVWCCTPNMTTEERDVMSKLLHTFGKAIYVDDEKFVDMSTSISGSGPAYIFMLMEAMIDSGVHMGFSRETATTLVHHTLLGSTLYAMETGLHPAILRNSVTSPAGTTASAIYELEKGGLRPLVNDAIWACYRRSLEMGGKNSAVGPGMNRAMGERPHITMHHHYNTPSGEMTWPPDGEDEDDGSRSKKGERL
jgi:pyrroline-5-carboxylate reductase